MTTVRDVATVTLAHAIDGRRHYRARAADGPRSSPVTATRVHPLVMATAERVLRPGERIVVVDANTVRTVAR